MEYRMEHDSMGDVRVPADRYWGAQTQRSFENFPIGQGREPMPPEIIHAFGILKKAAAITNARLCPTAMTAEKCSAICAAADEIISGKLADHFPLVVWQTGSGTQTNMNANEVIANRGNELAGRRLLHPNDDVNRSQSSNDTFPTALHIAAVCALEDGVLPALAELIDSLKRLEAENEGVIKAGRTHLQDATPISFPQEISGWRSSLERDAELIRLALPPLRELALGGTAVGTGLNAPAGFAERGRCGDQPPDGQGLPQRREQVPRPHLPRRAGLRPRRAAGAGRRPDEAGKRYPLARLRPTPTVLGELFLPENEAGSSIMPGKVNPTQCEGADDDRRAGHGERSRDRLCGLLGHFRAERLPARSGAQIPCSPRGCWPRACTVPPAAPTSAPTARKWRKNLPPLLMHAHVGAQPHDRP